MITLTREGSQAVTLEGTESDFQGLLKLIERAAHPDQKSQMSFRVLDEQGRHLHLIIRKGKSRDSL